MSPNFEAQIKRKSTNNRTLMQMNLGFYNLIFVKTLGMYYLPFFHYKNSIEKLNYILFLDVIYTAVESFYTNFMILSIQSRLCFDLYFQSQLKV